MPTEHFMRDDAVGAVLGVILFAPVLLAPGYVCGWLLNAFDFREQPRGWRAVISLLLSVAAAPIVVFLLGSFLSMRAVWLFYGLAAAFTVMMEFRSPGTSRPRVPGWVVWTALGWAVVVCASGIDLQFGERLYPPVLAYDFNMRTEIVQSLVSHGLPAVNPLFFPGHAVPLRYHYFWFIPCALVDMLGGRLVNARQALIAGDVWCGWALMAVAVLFLRIFHPAGDRNLAGRAKWAIGLLAVAGLDLLPNLFYDVGHALTGGWFVYSSAEWWNEPFTGFPHAVFFEAHHVAGVIACLIGLLLLWRGRSYARAAGAGLCFGSSVGLSVYVAFTFAIFLAVWVVMVLIRHGWRESVPWVLSGVIAAACAAPFLLTIAGAGGGGSFARFAVRGFAPFDTVLPAFGLSWNTIAVVDFLALPLNYFLETGVWFVMAILWWRRLRRRGALGNDAVTAAVIMFTVSLLVGTFLRSNVINNNDLGWRSVLFAQFIVLIWSVDPLRAWWRSRPRRAGIYALLALGLASTVYDFAWMRAYIPMSDAGLVPVAKWFGSDRHQGELTFAARQVYERVAELAPQDAVLQENPNRWNDVYYGLYGLRQTAAFDWICGAELGGDPRECARMQSKLMPLFNDPTASRSIDIDQLCDAWGIGVLVAKSDDPVFTDRCAWPWKRAAIAGNERVKAIQCGTR
jgi:hypothetical protein